MIDDLQTLMCRMPTQWHRLLTRLQAETTPREMGAKSWNEVLRIRWRLSTGEASRRLHEAADLAARTSLVGQPLAPLLPAVAAAQSAGLITGEHVATIRDAIKRLPSLGRHHHRRAVRGRPGARRGRRRTQRAARDRRPAAVPARSGRPRTRRHRTGTQTPRHHQGRKGRDAMTAASANLTPHAWAVWEVIFAKYAAPGMCNPADDRTLHLGHPQPSPDRQRRPHPGPTPARRDAGDRAHRVDER